jgi:hypothetical protein
MKTKKTKENHAETEQSKPFPQSPCCGWDGWSNQEIMREIHNRMAVFYLQIDGTFLLPNTKEGDLLKMVLHMIHHNRQI